MKRVTRTISVEDLVREYPGSVPYLIQQSLPCLVCGEPSWGSLEELGKDHGLNDEEVDKLVEQMNATLLPRESV
jgi:hypothetical protein